MAITRGLMRARPNDGDGVSTLRICFVTAIPGARQRVAEIGALVSYLKDQPEPSVWKQGLCSRSQKIACSIFILT
jgi:hypothetical protein